MNSASYFYREPTVPDVPAVAFFSSNSDFSAVLDVSDQSRTPAGQSSPQYFAAGSGASTNAPCKKL
jgi:hypothetical protein